MKSVLACIAIAAIGCGPSKRGDDTSPTTHIEIEPADATVTIVNGAPVIEDYTATLVTASGDRSDVTATTTFTVADSSYGSWAGAAFTVSGGGAGPTQISASSGANMGTTSLTVMVQGFRNDGAVPTNAADLFGAATENAAIAPAIAYPADGITAPPNIGNFDVHWQAGGDDLFEVDVHNDYVDLKIYKAGSGGLNTFYIPAEWYALASTRTELSLTVAGLVTSTPGQKGTSPAQKVEVTNESIAGGLYYWSIADSGGGTPTVMRYDMSTPDIVPASFFTTTNPDPSTCVGCHALSRDGTKMAITIDGGGGRATIYDLTSNTMLVPIGTGLGDPSAQMWNFASFTADASELVTIEDGVMNLRSGTTGLVMSTVPSSPGMYADHPEFSPDGTRLANVEETEVIDDYQADDGTIVTRAFDQGTNTFGAITTLVPNAAGASNYYPSWSPDGQWIVFTRTVGNSYADTSAEIWVVKSDGTQPPIQLALADTATPSLENSWARWAPFAQTFGANDEPMYYLTFSSTRPYGVLALGTSENGGPAPQLWMMPFFPDRATGGQDPSGPAFRLPFQTLQNGNHIAQWADAVVIARKADGSPLTQAEAAANAKAKN